MPPSSLRSRARQRSSARRLRQPHDTIINPAVQVPVIDFRKIACPPSSDVYDDELGRLYDACKHWGFFQVVNHGVSNLLEERMKKEVQEWFNIPMEEKKKFWQRSGDLKGFGQVFVVSEEQKLDWGDMFFITTHLRTPYLFPLLPLSLRRDTLEYSAALNSLAMKILNLMAKALGMDRTDMNVLFGEEAWRTIPNELLSTMPAAGAGDGSKLSLRHCRTHNTVTK